MKTASTTMAKLTRYVIQDVEGGGVNTGGGMLLDDSAAKPLFGANAIPNRASTWG